MPEYLPPRVPAGWLHLPLDGTEFALRIEYWRDGVPVDSQLAENPQLVGIIMGRDPLGACIRICSQSEGATPVDTSWPAVVRQTAAEPPAPAPAPAPEPEPTPAAAPKCAWWRPRRGH